ncbi:MAG: prepilin-type N-terminal cleavage/methylation domain-containing protein [Thermodesulfobacteriota bacterium]
MVDRRKRSGFTLIELMTVMIVFSVLAAIAVPTITAWLPNYRLRATARDVASSLQQARLRAASNSLEYRVIVNTGSAPYSIQIDKGNLPSGSTAWTCDGSSYIEFTTDVIINSVTPAATNGNFPVCRPDGSRPVANGYQIIFLPNGSTAVGSEFKVKLTNANGIRWEIKASNTTGRVKVEQGWT